MLPEKRRDELAADDRRHVRGDRVRPPPGVEDDDDRDDDAEPLDGGRQAELDARPVEERAEGEVVRGRDGSADPAEDGHVVGPRPETGHDRGRHRRGGEDGDPDDGCPVAPGHDGPAEQQRRLDLHDRPERHRDPQRTRPVAPTPAGGEGEEQERPDLAELDRVEVRPADAGQEEDRPADARADREESAAEGERAGEDDRPDHRPAACRQPRERDHEDGEGRRIEEDREPAGDVDRRVVQRLPGQQAVRRLDVRLEVVAEGVAGRPGDRRRPADEDEEGDDRERRPGQPDGRRRVGRRRVGGRRGSRWRRRGRPVDLGRGTAGGHRSRPGRGSTAARRIRRWSNGMRMTSKPTRRARPGEARMRDPRRSVQRIGTTAIR